mmetsp:Transcript_6682/g.18105  ORF Transcript_6682/g.18105 Transcript_6682/m.18105 type:complete len:209 (-) Transcript_6682:1450-2076(-)
MGDADAAESGYHILILTQRQYPRQSRRAESFRLRTALAHLLAEQDAAKLQGLRPRLPCHPRHHRAHGPRMRRVDHRGAACPPPHCPHPHQRGRAACPLQQRGAGWWRPWPSLRLPSPPGLRLSGRGMQLPGTGQGLRGASCAACCSGRTPGPRQKEATSMPARPWPGQAGLCGGQGRRPQPRGPRPGTPHSRRSDGACRPPCPCTGAA